ncbi:MAG: hypothetical protein KMY55_12590 [Dethiosulfatibacter sp.]|nr:hypothetical protein [Dethiosulfatibacter sp.]
MFDLDIGIKYCGGCNPRYNRLEFVSQLKKIASHHNYKSHSEGFSDVNLVVCGCKRACANLDKKDATNGIIIDDDSTIESIIEAIQIAKK